MEQPLKIYFLGSGLIAVNILKAAAAAPGLELVGVGTQLDRPAGRARKLTPTPVGLAAEEMGLNPEKIASVNTPEFLASLRAKAPDMILVVSFGQLLKEEILKLPRCGCINVHASILPEYRGASPIISAIRDGRSETGVSFMRMERGLDTGAVYAILRVPLLGSESAGALELLLSNIAAENLEEILIGIASGKLPPVEQDHDRATSCRKIKKSDGIIDWQRPAAEISAMVRAYQPWPGASMKIRFRGREIALAVNMARVRTDFSGLPGAILQADKRGIIIGCGVKALELQAVTPAGKKVMSAAAFLNGCNLAAPDADAAVLPGCPGD